MSSEGFPDRLKMLYAERGKAAFARRAGIANSTLNDYEKGREPTISKAVAIAAAAGVSLRWLLTGEGSKFEAVSPKREPDVDEHLRVDAQGLSPIHRRDLDRAASGEGGINGEIMGRVVDRIMRVYRDLGMTLQPVDLGRLAAEKYAEIRAACQDDDELPAHLDLLTVRLRKAILGQAAAPGSGKAEA